MALEQMAKKDDGASDAAPLSTSDEVQADAGGQVDEEAAVGIR